MRESSARESRGQENGQWNGTWEYKVVHRNYLGSWDPVNTYTSVYNPTWCLGL